MMDYQGILQSMERDFNKNAQETGIAVGLLTPQQTQDDTVGVAFFNANSVDINENGRVQSPRNGKIPEVPATVVQRLVSNIKCVTGLEVRMY